MTDAERLFWARLRRRKLHGHRFRRQHTICPYNEGSTCSGFGTMMLLTTPRGAVDHRRCAWRPRFHPPPSVPPQAGGRREQINGFREPRSCAPDRVLSPASSPSRCPGQQGAGQHTGKRCGRPAEQRHGEAEYHRDVAVGA
ncbi:MAG: DUF559 domain-containing protein [Candidatus Schekmanbacteria bacterium]|nr:DUF559 domain-containing protein [Candidatus Schekmanbacteria bacterium]